MLRHTFGTKIVKSKGVLAGQKLLGHASSSTTEIYTHLHLDELKSAITSIDKPSMIEKVRRLRKKKSFVKLDSNIITIPRHLIGRRKELKSLSDSMEMRVNTYVCGDPGIGKSKLLESITDERVIFLDDFRQVKTTLTNLFNHLMSIGKSEILTTKYDKVNLTKKSSKNICDMICGCVSKNEYTIVIDDLTNVTKSGIVYLEVLKQKFHMIVAARKMKIEYTSFMSNFKKIDLKGLNRDNCCLLYTSPSPRDRG